MKLHRHLLALVLAGFMVCAYAAPEKAAPEARPNAEATEDPISKYASPGEDAVGDMLLQAVSLLGVAYRFGGSTPNTGLDCSGFIQYVFKKSLKVNLPRTASEMAHVGRAVDKAELIPGDLVFFNTRGFAYSHVGIYLGNGKFIHSPRTGKTIEVTTLNQSYWVSHWNGARRVSRTGTAGASAAADVSDTPATSSPSSARCTRGAKKCRAAASAARRGGGAKKSAAHKAHKHKH
ncbi:C40 family peptidase [Paludibacterium yongneupense]|uniref:C40 family peptidase n=1 Tax=Paludibacterium yongneupense TaxID=400061 RepID=UPI000688AD71|nr:C40 family peptidase [Paludibacterium yongneupense]